MLRAVWRSNGVGACSISTIFYTQQDDPDFLYSAEELESYEESLEFVDFMFAIPDENVLTLERCGKLRTMKPVNPK